MRSSDKDKKIQENLQPGEVSIHGFLGEDKRRYQEIIAEDKKMLVSLGLTETEIAKRLEYITNLAFESYDGPIVIDEIYEVEYRSYRGKLTCPFNHSGVYRKGLITLKNLKNLAEVKWTPLNIHMIREHCFFEGKGSQHRIDPKLIAKAIFD